MTENELMIFRYGEYYGYPRCCINWFIENIERPFPDVIPLTVKQEEVHGSRGFIPCPACAEKVTHETIDLLIKDRICPYRYPNDDLDHLLVNSTTL